MSAIAEHPSLDWLNRRSYPFEPNYLEVSGGRMHYIDEGQGEPILFLHGCPTWSYMFRAAIRQLSEKGFRCIAPDHIGFGLSDKPQNWSYTPAAHSQNIERLVNHLGLSDITLVGHDLGGPIGLAYAVEFPEQIKRVILMNTWLGSLEKDEAAQKVAKTANGPLGKFLYLNTCAGPKGIKSAFVNREKYTEELQKAYQGPFATKDGRTATLESAKHLADSRGWYNEIWSGRQALAGKPMLLLWGLKDSMFGKPMLNRIWHEYPLADVATFEDGGHYLIEEKPRETISALVNFMCAPVKSQGFLA